MPAKIAIAKRPRERQPRRRRSGFVNALRRGLDVLEVIAGGGGRLPLTEIARGSKLHVSTCHHLVKTLESLSYITRDPSRQYRLARRVFQLAAVAWNEDALVKVAEPFVAELSLKTGESTQLAVFERDHAVVVAKFESIGPLRLVERVGTQRPAYCTAIGKALLAFQNPVVIQNYLRTTQLVPHTPKTVPSVARLKADLQRIERQGYAVDDEESSAGIRCIAAPVFNFAGTVVAALGLSGAASQLSPSRVRRLAVTAKAVAEQLSRELAYRGPYPGDGARASS